MMHTRRNTLKTLAGLLALGALSAAPAARSAPSGSRPDSRPQQAASEAPRAAKPTLVLVSHPYFERSTLTKGLQQAAESVQGATVRNLDAIYGKSLGTIDTTRETELIRRHDRLVLVYPTHWFNTTPQIKAWLNDVWGSVGPGLWQGKELLIVTTAGGGDSTYGKGSRTGLTMDEILAPMRASAAHTGMIYLKPLYFLGASAGRLPDYQKQLIDRLTH